MSIKAVVADEWNRPRLRQIPRPEVPEGSVRIKVLAAGVHRVVRDRITGTHYSAQTLPHLPGIDGIGQLDDGSKVYFSSIAIGGGGFQEEIVLPKHFTKPLPDGADIEQTAMGPWMALQSRWAAKNSFKDGFKVLVVGATSAAGQLAAHFARGQGATCVIGAARDAAKVDALKLFDSSMPLDNFDKEQLKDVDLIIDFVWGPGVGSIFSALPSIRPITWINTGGLGGEEAPVRVDAFFRGKNVTLVGSGLGAWDPKTLGSQQQHMLDALLQAMKAGLKADLKVAPLSDFDTVWKEPLDKNVRLVFKP